MRNMGSSARTISDLMRKTVTFVLASLLAAVLPYLSALAQGGEEDFYVLSFKRLDWDLDARVNYPEKDRNGKKAAIIKVITTQSAGFTFDVGIMGVVDQQSKPGETWLYVPEGIRKITVSHPEYGVIRDWPLGIPVESAVVYELRLHVPQRPQRVVVERDTVVRDSLIYVPVEAQPAERGPLGIGVMAVGAMPDASFGGMAVWYRRFGGYAKFRSNFRPGSWAYSCTSDGRAGSGYVWTSGDSEEVSAMRLSAGGIWSPWPRTALYAGGGYGRRVLLWRDNAGDRVKVSDRSAEGVALECGVILRVGWFVAQAGVGVTMPGRVDFEIGAGVSF